jgi:hypothetical protein
MKKIDSENPIKPNGHSDVLQDSSTNYVYCYCDPRKPYNKIVYHSKVAFEPFYVGCGIRGRRFRHLTSNDTNKLKVNKIRSIQTEGLNPIILILKEGLPPSLARSIEMFVIKELGTIANVSGVRRGILTNLTPGGDGGPTWFGRKHTPEQLKKMSFAQIGKKRSDSVRQAMSLAQQKNTFRSLEHLEKLHLGHKNMPDASRERISKATKGTKWVYNPVTLERERILIDLLDTYMQKGWKLGHHGFPKEEK